MGRVLSSIPSTAGKESQLGDDDMSRKLPCYWRCRLAVAPCASPASCFWLYNLCHGGGWEPRDQLQVDFKSQLLDLSCFTTLALIPPPLSLCVCVCVCVCEREREREREYFKNAYSHTHVYRKLLLFGFWFLLLKRFILCI